MNKQLTIEELPPVLTAQQIADYLIIARQTVYGLFDLPPERGGIRNFPIGKSRRARKAELIRWIEMQEKQQDTISNKRLDYIEGIKTVS
ncbi:helix-turn-helix domain-containing protein [Paenibacillus sp. HN-1]|uniref:helix-turn-helix domain-containing protein n=1 Tax=Paenibacillus TaxID=44249 RepID=UPI001CA9F7F0|nr:MULTISPECIES: helix-turn-helix domain-containing protein [Paenibacillus]MBY9081242.1 helix-turn-helix domain-containing protein [Paenibacillus sp. CGMCC 1.18879]MBY9087279.1 helix-turn-helix domain-containing protein [Paenibacillus sinensis]